MGDLLRERDACRADWSLALAKYGLGQVDLNLLVQMSLAGLTEAPERHLSELLRSRQPIEERTRTLIADILDGRKYGVRLEVKFTNHNKIVRSFRRYRQKIEIGRRVKAEMERMTYAEAVSEVAGTSRLGEKSIEGCYTLLRRLESWAQGCRASGLLHSDLELEMAFVYSISTKTDLDNALKPSVELLAKFVTRFEDILTEAQGICAHRN